MQKIKHSNFTVIVALISFVGLGLVLGLIGVAWPSMQKQFNLPLDGINGLAVAQTLAYSLASLTIARLMQRFGTGWALILATAILVVANLGLAASNTWFMVTVLAILSTFGAGLLDTGMNIYTATYHSARQMNWLHASFGVGITISPLIMTYALAQNLGWQTGYGIVGALLIIVVGLFVWTRTQWRSDRIQLGQEVAVHRASMRDSARLPVLWLIIAVFIAYGVIELGYGQWAYVVLTEGRGIAPEVAGTWISIYWGAFTVGRILFGFVAHRFEIDHVLRLGTVGMLIGAALFWWNPHPSVGLISLIVLGFIQAPFFPLLVLATAKRVGPEHAENSIGIQMGTAGLIGSVVRGAIGTIGENQGIEMMAVALFVVAAGLLILHELVRLQKPAPAPVVTTGD